MGHDLTVIKTISPESVQFTIGGLTQFKKALSELAGFLYEWKLRDGWEGDESFYYFLDSDWHTKIEEADCMELLADFLKYRGDFLIDCQDKGHPSWMVDRYERMVELLKLAVENEGRILFE